MHKRSCRLKRVAAARFILSWALGLGLLASAGAGPLGLQEAPQQDPSHDHIGKILPTEPATITAEELSAWEKAGGVPAVRPDSTQRADRPAASQVPAGQVPVQRPGAAPAAGNTDTDLGKSVHSAIKESVRPVYDQLVESGAVETLHDVKESLGLNKSQWSDQEKTDNPVKPPGQWDASGGGSSPDVNQPPRTEAQAKMDREMATMMREKLIDQITPWVIGLVGLYIVGYLVRLLVGYVRWKTAKRNKSRIARAQRHTSRRLRSSTRSASATSAPTAKAPPKETV